LHCAGERIIVIVSSFSGKDDDGTWWFPMPLPEFPAGLAPPDPVRTRLTDAFAALEQGLTAEIRVDLAGLPRIQAELVRWLLLTAIPASAGTATRLALWHATIVGRLNLAGARLPVTPCFAGCTFLPGGNPAGVGIDLADATVIGFEVIGGSLGAIRADRLSAGGSVLIRGVRQDVTYPHELPADVGPTVTIPHGVLLSGSKIRGNLDLRGARIGAMPEGHAGGSVAVLADGLSVEGNMLLGDGTHVEAEVRLNGSLIQRNLDCSGALLSNAGGYSLSAAGAEIKGTVYLRRSATGVATRSVGALRLEGARILGDLDASGAVLTTTAFHVDGWQRVREPPAEDNEEETVALCATGIEVAGDVMLKDGFAAEGTTHLIAAKISGDLYCLDARFHFPGEESFCADGASVSGCAYFSNSRSTGLVRFVQAQFKQGCYFDGCTFDVGHQRRGWRIPGTPVETELGSDLAGVYAAGAEIGGTFIWTGVRLVAQGADLVRAGGAPRRVTWLSAPGATMTAMTDDEASWSIPIRMDLRNCVYQRIDQLTADVTWRLARLDREYAQWNTHEGWGAVRLGWEVLRRTWRNEHRGDQGLGEQVRRFAPGPYLQLARVCREAGLEKAAQTVLLRLERNRARYSGLAISGILWRWLIDLVLRYGLSPFRPVLFVLVWAAASGVLFKVVQMHAVDAADRVTFNGFFYALDTLVPFVDFGQKKHFLIEPMWSWGGLLLLVNTALGYAAASFLAAGLSGLVRIGKSNG
jgi:hypothetical protein